MLILGIETSCDETSAAVVADGRDILSNIVASQIEVHAPFGGVVPELASRHHLEKIRPIVVRALGDANVALSQIDAVAVTQGPGLIGALLVGICFAKAFAYGRGLPLLTVDHLEGHIRSAYVEADAPIGHPALALVVSGGHTSLFLMEEESSYRLIGKTRDDAAGEAYDKVAKRLGLGYPGGPVIDRLAALGNAERFPLPVAKISDGSEDFSFSGLKTAVMRTVERHRIPTAHSDEPPEQDLLDLCASFQRAVVSALVRRILRAAQRHRVRTVLVSGGVAANRGLREECARLSSEISIPVIFPSMTLSTDNAAMIAAAGYLKWKRGEVSELNAKADVELRLGELGPKRSARHR